MADLGISGLKTEVDVQIYTNHAQAITGAIMNDTLIDTIDTLKNGGNLDAKSVDTAQLADGAVEALQINAGAVTEAKIGSGAVTGAKIGAKAVTSEKIADDAIVRTFAGAVLLNPYSASLTPRRVGDIAINTTTGEIWQSTSIVNAAASWNRVSASFYNGSLITNWNTINLSGDLTSYGDATGAPTANESFYGHHINSNAGTANAYQIAIGYTTGKIYHRSKSGSTWGEWSVGVTPAELGYLSGVTSNIQTQFDNLDELLPFITGKNLYDESNAIDGYISASNGSINSLVEWRTSDFIGVNGLETLVFSINPIGAAETTREAQHFYFFLAYDENKEPITDTYANDAGLSVTPSIGWHYIRFAYQRTTYQLPQVEVGSSVTSYESFSGARRLKDSDYVTSGELAEEMSNIGEYHALSWVSGYRMVVDGKISKITASNLFCTILDKVNAGDKYIISLYSSSMYNWVAVDDLFNVIEYGTVNNTVFNLEITAPNGAAYMVFNARNNWVYEAKKLITIFDITDKYDLSDLTWNAIGDSVTEIDQVQSSINNFLQGYVTGVKNEISFAKVNNYGKSGHLLPKGITGYTSVFEDSATWEIADIYTIMLGINGFTQVYDVLGDFNTDYIGRTGWNTLYGAWREAIEYIYSVNPKAIIILSTEHFFQGANTESLLAKYRAVNKATTDVAYYENIPVIDCLGESGINAHTISSYLYDGTHPSQDGFNRITALFSSKFKNVILDKRYRY